MNKVILIGNLTKNMELKYATNVTAIGKFTLAVNTVLSAEKTETLFIDCVIFSTRAEKLVSHLTKGKKIAVDGRLVQNSWVDSEGRKRTKIEVIVETLEFCSKGNGNQDTQSQPKPKTPDINIDEEDIPF